MKSKLSILALAVASLGVAASANASLSLDFIEGTAIPAPYVTYGDANSYSLPVLGILYDIYSGNTVTNSIQPSNPYYITSTPGAIKDLTVIGTGASGQPVNTNFPGMDNAYPTPNSDGITFFSTQLTPDPGGAGEFTGDAAGTWDVRLSSFSTFLDGEAPVFLFNNNQTNSGASTNQNLAVWAAITLYSETVGIDPLTLYFHNVNGSGDPQPYALVSEGGGGVLFGTAGSGTPGTPTDPIAGTNQETDYVLSGGALCYDAALTIISCSSPGAVGGPINHNLGANQAVYAVVFPTLDQILADPNFSGYHWMSIDWRMGCDPATIDPEVNCIGRSLNNGYEQLFITTRVNIPPPPNGVPEPGTLALLGLGLLGLGAMRRRKA